MLFDPAPLPGIDYFSPMILEQILASATRFVGLSRCLRCSMTTPRARACCRQHFMRLFSELYCRGVNRPGNCLCCERVSV